MIVRSCVRIAAVMAIRGNTWADDRVYDSNNTPLAEALRQEPAPFVSIFTDDDEGKVDGRDVLHVDSHELKLTVEFGIAGPFEKDEGDKSIVIPATDDAFERVVDVLERQIACALFHDPKNSWGEIFRGLVIACSKTASKRAGEAERGARWAARQRVFTVETVSDPTPGAPIGGDHPIAAFIAACRADSDTGLDGVADMIEALIGDAAAPTWRQAQAMLGLMDAEVRGIGLAPPYPMPDDETPAELIGFTPGDDEFTDENVAVVINPDDLPRDKDLIVLDPNADARL
jgi:hypothetical protein